ncbi:DUF7059 domain-containing protein [Streptomyces sp. URMC 129]|uniref:DUF7059 domain-containing protein n=1 Tax=Streptomyces sp. URMC 129 TaxID=3423407 RepID=UPI003F1A4AEA
MSTTPLPPPAAGPGASLLRGALLAASFTPDGLLDLLGAPAYAALARGETVPARRATREADTPAAVLTRLFLLRLPVPLARVRHALPSGATRDATLDAALGDGWLVRDGDEVRATADVRPYAGDDGQDWWIVSDALGHRGEARDIVLGVGGASTTLAGLTIRRPARRVLDLGTGCGVQALHATRHADRVTATDVNPRALRMAAATLALSGAPAADLREGSLFEPVKDARDGGDGGENAYDLIVSNPPFVISPARAGHGGGGLTYRDGGLAGDELCRTVVGESAAHLADGGWCQILANWQQVDGEDWRERVAAWVPPGCDAWIVRREEQDVTQYTELWLRDAGAHRGEQAAYEEAYAAWLDEFAARRTHAVGFGWITLRKSGAGRPSVVVEDWPHPVEQPLGETIRAHFARQDFLRSHDDAALLRTRYVLADGVVQEQLGAPGAEDPEHVVLRQRHGMLRARAMDTVGAGLAGSCDGTLTAGTILDAIARLLDVDPVAVRSGAPEWLRPLVEQGFLIPRE